MNCQRRETETEDWTAVTECGMSGERRPLCWRRWCPLSRPAPELEGVFNRGFQTDGPRAKTKLNDRDSGFVGTWSGPDRAGSDEFPPAGILVGFPVEHLTSSSIALLCLEVCRWNTTLELDSSALTGTGANVYGGVFIFCKASATLRNLDGFLDSQQVYMLHSQVYR